MHNPSVPLAEAKNRLSELIDRVSRGEEIVVCRHNTDIARLVPIGRPPASSCAPDGRPEIPNSTLREPQLECRRATV
jgi:prevent-host-death family protein